MSESRRPASAAEIAALLMDAVCTPAPKEQGALGELASVLRVDLGQMQAELMFLRAFAADFATAVALGPGPQREAILARYYGHWERIDGQVGGVLDDLRERLEFYTELVSSARPDADGLQGLLGRAFARLCGADAPEQELAALGGAMFGAVFTEIADLLQEVDIIATDGGGAGPPAGAN